MTAKPRSEMSRPELYAMIDSLQETVATVAERVRDGSLASRPTRNAEVGVKGLEWQHVMSSDYVETILGTYLITSGRPDSQYKLSGPASGLFASVAAAKSAAQADFDQRIRSALASPPSPAEVTTGWPPAPDGWTVGRPTYVRQDGKVSVEYCHGADHPWQVRLSHGNGASHSVSEHDFAETALNAALDQHGKEG